MLFSYFGNCQYSKYFKNIRYQGIKKLMFFNANKGQITIIDFINSALTHGRFVGEKYHICYHSTVVRVASDFNGICQISIT